MKISAITQKFNNKQFDSQRFQQNSGITTINQMPKCDTVSFGMAKLSTKGLQELNPFGEELEYLGKSLIEYLQGPRGTFVCAEASERYALKALRVIEAISHKPPELQKAFVLKQGIWDSRSSKNFGNYFEMASYYNCEVTDGILEMAFKVAPKEFFNGYKLSPKCCSDEILKNIAKRIAAHDQFTKDETLQFLKNNNHEGKLDDIIRIVQNHATD